MTKFIILKESESGLGDFDCPSCKACLEVDEDNFYYFTVEPVECSHCHEQFFVRGKIDKTFEIMKR